MLSSQNDCVTLMSVQKVSQHGRVCRANLRQAFRRCDSTWGVILARLLKEPKVTKPLELAGSGETGGASADNQRG